MNHANHHFSELFAQLGLPTDEQGIQQFIKTHAPLPTGIKLPEAPFWTPAQTAFLQESLLQDSDWAELADQLSNALR